MKDENKEWFEINEAETMTMNVVKNLVMQIDTKIEDFIVRSIEEYSEDETIVVNPKLIYEAIKKQKAMKPVLESNICYKCPVCNESLEFEGFWDLPTNIVHYCVRCGQKIDWSEQEETE